MGKKAIFEAVKCKAVQRDTVAAICAPLAANI